MNIRASSSENNMIRLTNFNRVIILQRTQYKLLYILRLNIKYNINAMTRNSTG